MTLSTYPISNGLPAFNLGPSFLEYAIQREMKMASIKENLIAARALIDTPEKWGKNFYYESNGCLCAIGAIGKAKGGSAAGGQFCLGEINALNNALPDAAPIKNHVPAFNDHPSTTHSDIMSLFDRAIAAQDELA